MKSISYKCNFSNQNKRIYNNVSKYFNNKHHKYFSIYSHVQLSTSNNYSKKVIMISLDWTRPKDPPLSLGHASILTNLITNNIDVIEKSWSVNHETFNIDDILHFIESHSVFTMKTTTTVAIGVFVWNEQYVQAIIQYLKQHKYRGQIILGGPQISYVKTNIEKYYPNGDIFIRGYAEDVLVKYLLSNDKYPVIQGIHYANQPSLNQSALSDLNHLPSPYLNGILKKQRFLRWETQRGCPFRCSFCQHRESDSSQKRRSFPTLRIEQEIEWLVTDNIVQDIAVLDPTFNSGNNYLYILEKFATLNYKGKLSLQCRIEMVQPEFLELVEEINKTGQVVLEFGIQTIHKQEQKYIQRPNNLTKIKTILKETEKKKIQTELSLIFGLPGQTLQSFQESIDFCKSYHVSTIHAFPLMLLRGTPLYDQKQEYGLIESSDNHLDHLKNIPRITTNNISHVISSPTFSYEDWLKMGELADELELSNVKKDI